MTDNKLIKRLSPVAETPGTASLTLDQHCPLVTCGQHVARGATIATAMRNGTGDLHAPFAGKITHVDAFIINLTAEGSGQVEPRDLSGLTGTNLLDALIRLGADVPRAPSPDFLIINSVDVEDEVFSRSEILQTQQEFLEIGVKTLKAVFTPSNVVLAELEGTDLQLNGSTIVTIEDAYPLGLDPLVAFKVTGREKPENTVVIGIETVMHVGMIMTSGLPVLETVVTLGKANYLVGIGTPVGSLLEQTGEMFNNLDRIVIGGPLRGRAVATPGQGIDRRGGAVMVIHNLTPVALDAPCVGCGECVRICPARLDPSMITSYAEFEQYDACAREHIGTCMECGLCGYFCIARRPMLQYIRMGKAELSRLSEKELQEVS